MKLKHSVWGDKSLRYRLSLRTQIKDENLDTGTQGPRPALGQSGLWAESMYHSHHPHTPQGVKSTHLVTLPFLDTLGLLLSWGLP